MAAKLNYHILVTGLMNSGKSTLMSEYLHAFDSIEFTPPPIKVQYEGLDFEFLDAVFAIEVNGSKYNFYELDAPTISKWHQFISIADAVLVVYNHMPSVLYGSHDKLAQVLYKYTQPSSPLIFVINNFDNLTEAEASLKEKYQFTTTEKNNIEIVTINKGTKFFDDKYGPRIKLDTKELENMINTVVKAISKRITQ